MKLLNIFKLLAAIAICSLAYSCDGDNESNEIKPDLQESIITCDISSLTFDTSDGIKTITIETNNDWSAKVLGDVSWCTLSAYKGASGVSNISVKVSNNTDYIERKVSIFIQCGDQSHTILVIQKQMDALLLVSNKFEINQEGGSVVVEVKANIDYQLEIIGDAKNWIRESRSRGLSEHSHTFVIDANEDSNSRVGEICFINELLSETVKIFQSGSSSVLLLSQNEFFVSDEGDVIEVEIKSNVDYGVQMPDVDWITQETASRALSSHTLRYIIQSNSSYNERSAYILFFDKNSSLTEKLNIIQKQKDVISVAKQQYEVGSEANTIEIDVFSNVPFDITVDAEWIKHINSSVSETNNHKIQFSIEENQSSQERTGTIVITDKDKTIKQEIAVKQLMNVQEPTPEDKDPEGSVDDMDWG